MHRDDYNLFNNGVCTSRAPIVGSGGTTITVFIYIQKQYANSSAFVLLLLINEKNTPFFRGLGMGVILYYYYYILLIIFPIFQKSIFSIYLFYASIENLRLKFTALLFIIFYYYFSLLLLFFFPAFFLFFFVGRICCW